jgi:mRNA interferase HigB
MRIIKRSTLVSFWEQNPAARSSLLRWHALVRKARWTCLQDVRATFPHADPVTVASGRSAVVFNIAGNKYRLITAIHYNRQLIFTLKVLTHREYSKGIWKELL